MLNSMGASAGWQARSWREWQRPAAGDRRQEGPGALHIAEVHDVPLGGGRRGTRSIRSTASAASSARPTSRSGSSTPTRRPAKMADEAGDEDEVVQDAVGRTISTALVAYIGSLK